MRAGARTPIFFRDVVIPPDHSKEFNDSHSRAIKQCNRSSNEDRPVKNFRRLIFISLRNDLQVECRGNQERNRDASQSACDGQELVELVVDGEGDNAGKSHNNRSRQVLAHLSLTCLRPRLEEPRLYDNISWVDDERVREEQVEAEQNLHDVSDDILLW